MILKLAKSLMGPSDPDQDGEEALIRFLAHVVAGAALQLWFDPLTVTVTYGLLKELIWDTLIEGGNPVDGCFDTTAIGVGAFLPNDWPIYAILLGLTHAWWVERK